MYVKFLYLMKVDLRSQTYTGMAHTIVYHLCKVKEMKLSCGFELWLTWVWENFRFPLTIPTPINIHALFQLTPWGFVVALRQTTGAYIAWRPSYILVLLLEEQTRYSLEFPKKCLTVLSTQLGIQTVLCVKYTSTTYTEGRLAIETCHVMLTSVRVGQLSHRISERKYKWIKY
jgi:hypothetical protein